jgi:hypothetical protein
MFPLLGALFLDHLLELVRFLAQLHEGLLCGIGFLSAFLRGAEIGYFRSIFLKTTAIASIVCRVRAPMLLAQVAMFLGTYLFWDSGTVSTRSLRTLLLAMRRFLVARSDGLFGSFMATLLAVQSFLAARSGGFFGYFLATYALDCLERQKERMHVHRSPTFLVKVELILPRVRARYGLGRSALAKGAGVRADQFGTYPQQPFSLWLS